MSDKQQILDLGSFVPVPVKKVIIAGKEYGILHPRTALTLREYLEELAQNVAPETDESLSESERKQAERGIEKLLKMIPGIDRDTLLNLSPKQFLDLFQYALALPEAETASPQPVQSPIASPAN